MSAVDVHEILRTAAEQKAAPDNALADHAVDYLQRKSLNNGPFRSATPAPNLRSKP